jgi:hypothetical protein
MRKQDSNAKADGSIKTDWIMHQNKEHTHALTQLPTHRGQFPGDNSTSRERYRGGKNFHGSISYGSIRLEIKLVRK